MLGELKLGERKLGEHLEIGPEGALEGECGVDVAWARVAQAQQDELGPCAHGHGSILGSNIVIVAVWEDCAVVFRSGLGSNNRLFTLGSRQSELYQFGKRP